MVAVTGSLLEQIEQLSNEQKQWLVRHLLDSLPSKPHETWEEAWERELLLRKERIDRGEAIWIPAEQVAQELRERFS